jgi:geranylgeranyl reductase family protein
VHDILVVGGGPAGSATAAFAARAGLRVLLIDRAHFPRDKACAEYLSPETARDLDALGALPRIEAAGAARLAGFRLVSDDGAVAEGRYERAVPFTPYRPWGYALPRRTFDAILLDLAREAGAEVREGVRLERLIRERGAVVGAETTCGAARDRLPARAVVGADGLNSRVARELGLARRGRPERIGLVAHAEGIEGLGDLGEMWSGRGHYLGIAPLGGGLANVAAVIPSSEAASIAAGADACLLAQLRRWPALAARTSRARLVRRTLVTGPFASRARAVTRPGVLLVGDAADFHDPFTGEGIFAAIRGARLAAATLEAALDGGGASAAALRGYASARARAFRGKWFLERLVAAAATRPALMRRFVRRLARHGRLADLWVGAAGDHVPVRALFTPARLAALVL